MDEAIVEGDEIGEFQQSTVLFTVEPEYDPSITEFFKVKNEVSKIVPPEQRKSRNVLTKYEKTRIICVRAEQLRHGAKPRIETEQHKHPRNNFVFKEVAEKELEAKKLPVSVKRYMPDGNIEIWHIDELVS